MNSSSHHTAILSPGKEKAVLNGHPWIFSGAIKKEPQDARPGDLVDVLDSKSKFIARGYINPLSQIRIRVLTRDPQQMITEDFLAKRIEDCIKHRLSTMDPGNNAARLICHEADLLPGLIVDLYDQWIVFQIVTAGMDRWRSLIVSVLGRCFPFIRGIYERSDDEVRKKEGLKSEVHCHVGQDPQELVVISEHGMKLCVDIKNGHKTGYYLDQAKNRMLLRGYSKGRRVLNCFSYTGGFGISALMGGALTVCQVDESLPALEIAKKNLALNGLGSSSMNCVKADVFEYLRKPDGKLSEPFDFIVLDPPKFIHSSKQIDKACRGYKDINLLAMKMLPVGGLLATFSCSGLMSKDLFQKVVFGASVDAGCEMQIIEFLSQSSDHPVLLSFPESHYLKGFLLRKI
jgi:23S rRNA (cytosine1962-C5)-methyltransferase